MKMKGDDVFEGTQFISENLECIDDFDRENMESTSVEKQTFSLEKQTSESESYFWNGFSRRIEKLMQFTNELSEPINKINSKRFDIIKNYVYKN